MDPARSVSRMSSSVRPGICGPAPMPAPATVGGVAVRLSVLGWGPRAPCAGVVAPAHATDCHHGCAHWERRHDLEEQEYERAAERGYVSRAGHGPGSGPATGSCGDDHARRLERPAQGPASLIKRTT